MDALRQKIATALSRAGMEATLSPDEGDAVYVSDGDADIVLTLEVL